MSEKKGFWDSVKETLFTPKKKGTMKLELDRLSIRVLKDERLQGRVEVITNLNEELKMPVETEKPEQYVTELKERLHKLDGVVRGVGITYLRGGDAHAIREITIAWERLLSLSLNIADTVMHVVEKPGDVVNEWALCHKLKSFLDVEVVPYGYMIIDASFYDKDISEKTAAVIIQPPSPTSGVQTKTDATGMSMMATKLAEIEAELKRQRNAT